MDEEGKLADEIKKLNNKLDELKSSGKFMIYSASPAKFALFNFLAGVFHTLGSLFGYIVIFGAVAYFISKVDLGKIMGNLIESSMSQVRWEKIMPAQNLKK